MFIMAWLQINEEGRKCQGVMPLYFLPSLLFYELPELKFYEKYICFVE